MFRSDKRNGKPVAAINTLIAAGPTIRGDVHFNGGLHLEGVIEGSIGAFPRRLLVGEDDWRSAHDMLLEAGLDRYVLSSDGTGA